MLSSHAKYHKIIVNRWRVISKKSQWLFLAHPVDSVQKTENCSRYTTKYVQNTWLIQIRLQLLISAYRASLVVGRGVNRSWRRCTTNTRNNRPAARKTITFTFRLLTNNSSPDAGTVIDCARRAQTSTTAKISAENDPRFKSRFPD